MNTPLSLRSVEPVLSSSPGLPDEVVQVLSRGRRVVTPCGEGDLVWHVWGEGRARPELAPLVLLHGGSGSWLHWLRSVLPLAATGRMVLVPDLPGFGDSAMPPGGADADVMPEPLERGLQELVGDAPCDFVGFSFGGMVAGLIAQRFPARVQRLVLVGPPGLGLSAIDEISLKGWRHLPRPEQREAVHAHNLRELMLHHEASITPLACALQALNAQRDRLPGRRLSRTDILARALRELRCTVHLMYGQHDRLYRGLQAQVSALMHGLPTFGQLVVVQDAGHWVQFERPQAFHEALWPLL